MRLIPPFNEIGYPLFRSINGSFVRVTTRPRLFAASFSSPALDVIRARVQIAPGSVLEDRWSEWSRVSTIQSRHNEEQAQEHTTQDRLLYKERELKRGLVSASSVPRQHATQLAE